MYKRQDRKRLNSKGRGRDRLPELKAEEATGKKWKGKIKDGTLNAPLTSATGVGPKYYHRAKRRKEGFVLEFLDFGEAS